MLLLFGKGLLFGVTVAAPVGPMALLCLRATLQQGFAAGVASGLGIALADATYATLAAFGLGAATALGGGFTQALQAIGGAYIAWLGTRTMLEEPDPDMASAPLTAVQGVRLVARTFLLTLANPPTIMMFAAFFAGMGLVGDGSEPGSGLAVVLGVMLGSLGWWVLFASVSARLGHRLPPRVMLWINRISGAVLLALGLVMVVEAARPMMAG